VEVAQGLLEAHTMEHRGQAQYLTQQPLVAAVSEVERITETADLAALVVVRVMELQQVAQELLARVTTAVIVEQL
jgi:hypothetical protein